MQGGEIGELTAKRKHFVDDDKNKFIIIIFLMIISGIAYVFNCEKLTPKVWADLTYQTIKDKTNFQSGGTIRIEGWIYNNDSRDVNITLRLRVNYGTGSGYYGFLWIIYDVPVGVIPKGDKKWFSWECHLNPFDPTTATFNYTIIETK